MTDPRDTMRWAGRGSALAAVVIGWAFIAWQNHFHITAPVVFICLGYLAVIATIYNLWRTGAAAVVADDEPADSTWTMPAGAASELEREKRTLLKAIKEAEFDREMGKLSEHDAEEMIRTYRARAIEVIKEIDNLGKGSAGSTRDQILREVRARLELETRSSKKPAKAESGDGKRKKKPAKNGGAAEPEAAGSAAANAEVAEADAEDASASAAGEAAREGAADPVASAAAASAADDELLDADSTTAIEPTREAPGKVATP